MRSCLVRLAWIALLSAVLGVAAVLFTFVARIVAGPDAAPWGAAAWLLASVTGAMFFVRWRIRRREIRERPWDDDWRWSRTGDVQSPARRALGPFVLSLVALVYAAAWLVLHQGRLLSDALVAVYLSIGVLVIWFARRWFTGGVQARWDAFPMRTGTRVVIHVATMAGGSAMPEFTAFLRCVEPTAIDAGVDSPAQVAAHVDCATPGPRSAGPDEFMTLEFDIPADAPGTDLSRPGDERYWELVVLGTTAWGKIAETFVVPIYAVEGEAADGAAPASEV